MVRFVIIPLEEASTPGQSETPCDQTNDPNSVQHQQKHHRLNHQQIVIPISIPAAQPHCLKKTVA